MNILAWTGAAALLLALATIGAGQAGLLAGPAPAMPGVVNGRLAAPSPTPNSVSSQAYLFEGHPRRMQAQIEPLRFTGDGQAAMARLAALLQRTAHATLVVERPDYLYVQFRTPLLRFTDDAEFWLDPSAGVIQLRSASRLGRDDLGANRARIEALRARFSG